MTGQRGFWDFEQRFEELSMEGKPLEDLTATVDFEMFRPILLRALRHGIIRRVLTTDVAAYDGARLREGLIDTNNTASDVWPDTAYPSKANDDYLDKAGKVSRIHHKRPKGRPMPRPHTRGIAAKSKIRTCAEHMFVHSELPTIRLIKAFSEALN